MTHQRCRPSGLHRPSISDARVHRHAVEVLFEDGTAFLENAFHSIAVWASRPRRSVADVTALIIFGRAFVICLSAS